MINEEITCKSHAVLTTELFIYIILFEYNSVLIRALQKDFENALELVASYTNLTDEIETVNEKGHKRRYKRFYFRSLWAEAYFVIGYAFIFCFSLFSEKK